MVENTLDRPAPFDEVAPDDADEAVVGVGIYKNFDAEFIPQFGVCKNQNSLDDDHFFWFNRLGFFGAGTGEVRINRFLDELAFGKMFDVFVEQIKFDGIGVVEVDFLFFFLRKMAVILVIRVLRDDRNRVFRQAFNDFVNNSGLSRTRITGNSDN